MNISFVPEKEKYFNRRKKVFVIRVFVADKEFSAKNLENFVFVAKKKNKKRIYRNAHTNGAAILAQTVRECFLKQRKHWNKS